MKIKLLAGGMLLLMSATAFAQKGELSNAQDNFTKYEKFKMLGSNAVGLSLKAAKESIDKASANDKTATLTQTYALKGAIYAVLSVQDSVAATAAPLYATAEENLKKAKEADTKGEYKEMITMGFTNLAQYDRNQGVISYKAQKFADAYGYFEKYRVILPEDTDAMYFSGLSAALGNKFQEAITEYNRLLPTKYTRNAEIYYELSNLYLNLKDTANSVKVVAEGIAKYPANSDLRKRQIELYLRMGKQQEVINLLQSAIATDPKNKTFYYYGGFTYTQMGDMIDGTQKKTKAGPDKDKMEQAKLDDYSKAGELFKKALELDPNFFEANLNMGYVTLRPGIDMYNDAQQLPSSKQKEYDAQVAKAGNMMDAAKVYILKAVELNPKSSDALINLKTYYMGKHDMANANETQKKIDALKGQK